MSQRFKVMAASVALLLLTPVLFKLGILDVLDEARRGVDRISYSDKTIVLVSLGFFGALGSLVGAYRTPPEEDRHLRPDAFATLPDEYKSFAGVGVLVGVLAGFGLRQWFLGAMEALGYVAE